MKNICDMHPIISFIPIVIYITVALYRNGVPVSISSTYKTMGRWFTLIVGFSAASLIPLIGELQHSWLLFIGLVCILFVAVAYNLDDAFTGRVHTCSAVIALICSQIWVGITDYKWLWLWMLLIPVICIDRKNWKFWSELIMLTSLCGSMCHVTMA